MKRQLKRVLPILMALLLVASFTAFAEGQQEGSGEDEDAKYKFGMVTDMAGLGDQGFNDLAWKGLQDIKSNYSAKIDVVESQEMAQYKPNLSKLAQQGYDLTIGIGFLLINAIEKVANKFPDSNFLLIDEKVKSENGNLMSIRFKEYEGSFLAGVIAAHMTETGKIGFIGGMELPAVERWHVGFEAGVKAAEPDVKLVSTYVGSFEDPNKAKKLAMTQYNNDVDIIFHVGGQSGLGVIEAGKELGEGYYAIGSDAKQNHIAPDTVIFSVLKGVDAAVYRACERVIEGSFDGETIALGLEKEGMMISDTADETVPKEILARVDMWREMIINDEFEMPTKMDQLESFEPPQL